MHALDFKILDPALNWARSHERHLSALFMAGGFAFDSWAFGRIDQPATQAVFIIYLLVAGITIAAQHGLESRPEGRRPSAKIRAAIMFVTQFALGALLSGFCVFYIRSASLFSSWPFLLFMAGVFIGNEVFRHYYSRLVFTALLLFFSLYSYAIMLVPMLLGRIGAVPFLLSGAGAAVVFFFYMRAIARLGHERYRGARMQIRLGMGAISVFLNLFYFLKVLPPLPLVLTDAGIYHSVQRRGADIEVSEEREPPRWQALFGTNPVLHIQSQNRLYLYSAVFAPQGLKTAIVHDWQRQDGEGAWRSVQRVPVTIAGGRADGYRFYTFKSSPQPGQWRVNIETADGRAIGRVRFAVESQAVPPALALRTLKTGG
ncbi:MAG: DUF2914 domain-containing protein [Alphaproteobacteria bacterium]|nr:DUF2914 domain-containing protein [Alphaproteobacteria bacterium]